METVPTYIVTPGEGFPFPYGFIVAINPKSFILKLFLIIFIFIIYWKYRRTKNRKWKFLLLLLLIVFIVKQCL